MIRQQNSPPEMGSHDNVYRKSLRIYMPWGEHVKVVQRVYNTALFPLLIGMSFSTHPINANNIWRLISSEIPLEKRSGGFLM